MATMKDGAHISRLEGHQPFAYAVTEIPLLSLQHCYNFQTIAHTLHQTCKIFLKIIFCSTDVNVFALSLTK